MGWDGSFQVLIDNLGDPTDQVVRRMKNGVALNELLIDFYSSVSNAQRSCAANLRKAASHAEAFSELWVSDPSLQVVGSLLDEANVFVTRMALLNEQLVNAFETKMLRPLNDMAEKYEMVLKSINPSQEGEGGGPKETRGRRRLEAKIAVAEDEWEAAKTSRDQILARFGESIKPSLLQKVDDRIRKAQMMKHEAECALVALTDYGGAGPEEDDPGGGGVSADNIEVIEDQETERVLRTLDCIRLACRLWFTFIEHTAKNLVPLLDACDSYDPTADLSAWLIQTSGDPNARVKTVGTKKFGFSPQEMGWLRNHEGLLPPPKQNFPRGGPAPAAETPSKKQLDMNNKNNNKTNNKPNDNNYQTPPHHHHHHHHNDDGGEDDASSQQSSMTSGHSSSSSNFDEPHPHGTSVSLLPSAPPATLETTSADRRVTSPDSPDTSTPSPPYRGAADEESDDVGPEPHLEAGSYGDDEEEEEEENGGPSNPHMSILRRMATALQGNKGQERSNPQEEPSEDDAFYLTDYIPALPDRLQISWPKETRFADRALELERRVEEYLWALRSLNVDDLARVHPWDSEEYVRALDFEYGFQAYVHKAPRNTLHTACNSVQVIHALEWGSDRLDTRQWDVFAYETLVLAQQIAKQILISRELISLPHRDASKLPVDVMNARRQVMVGINQVDDALAMTVNSRFENGSQTEGVQILLYNSRNMIRVLRAWRVRLGYSGQENTLLLRMLLPTHSAHGYAYNPLDVRYRVHRLAVSWLHSKSLEDNNSTSLYREWVFRNLHFVRCAIFFKIQRFARFLPHYSEATCSWLLAWLLERPRPTAAGAEGGPPPPGNSSLPNLKVLGDLNVQLKPDDITHDLPPAAARGGVNLSGASGGPRDSIAPPRTGVGGGAPDPLPLTPSSALTPSDPARRNTASIPSRASEIVRNSEVHLTDVEEADWASYIQACLPEPRRADNEFCRENLGKLVQVFKLALVILADLCQAREEQGWGKNVYLSTRSAKVVLVGYDPECQQPWFPKNDKPAAGYGYKNYEAFSRLETLMSCMAHLDRAIRLDIATDEKEAPLEDGGGGDDLLSEENPQGFADELFEHKRFDLYKAQEASRLDEYWQYELPVQHLVLAHTCENALDHYEPWVVDPSSTVQGVQVVMLLNHLMQHGMDPTTTAGPLRVPLVFTSIDSVALYLVKSMWEALVAKPLRDEDEEDDEFGFVVHTTKTPPRVSSTKRLSDDGLVAGIPNPNSSGCGALPPGFVVPLEPLELMVKICRGFLDWLVHNEVEGDPTGQNVREKVSVRLLNRSLHNVFEALNRPRGQFWTNHPSTARMSVGAAAAVGADDSSRNGGGTLGSGLPGGGLMEEAVLGSGLRFTAATDPDFGVIDYRALDEVAQNPSFFHQLETIRQETEGVSLVLPSRVERIICELCMRRSLTDRFRTQLFHSLCDYRAHYDAASLRPALELYTAVSDLLVLAPPKTEAQNLDVAQLQSVVSLPLLLNGPVAYYDLLRHIICRSVRAIFARFCSEALQSIRQPTEDESWFLSKIPDLDDEPEESRSEVEKAWAVVIGKFASACQKVLIELRTEVIYFAEVWQPLLPGNQHAMIVVYTAEGCYRELLAELRGGPFWPEETLPPSSAGVTSALAQFQVLVEQVRVATRFPNLLAGNEALTEPLATAVATALTKRLRNVEPMLVRCINETEWAPVDPPRALYSAGAVDFFQFIHHTLAAVWEFQAPTDWVLPIIIQFLIRAARQYADRVKQSVSDPRLTNIAKYADVIASNLSDPLARVDIAFLHTATPLGKQLKKGIKGFLGFKKKKHRAQHHDSEAESEPPDDFGGGQPNAADPSPAPEPAEPEVEAAEVDVENEDFRELAGRIGHDVALQIHILQAVIAQTNSRIKSWLTRLHNLWYFHFEVSNLAMKVLNKCREKPPKDDEIPLALEKAGGRKIATYATSNHDESQQLQIRTVEAQLGETVNQCRKLVCQRAIEVCHLCALRIVYGELSDDIFVDLYNPSIHEGLGLTNLLAALDSTALKFVEAAPQIWHEVILGEVMNNLAKAWCLLLCELGYHGYVFTKGDAETLDSDHRALGEYCATKGVHIAEDLTKKMAEFLHRIRSQPELMAQLGGNLKKKTDKTLQPPTQQLAVDDQQQHEEVRNLFAEVGGASPAFNAEEIVGKKKKKGWLSRAAKVVKLN